MTAPLLTKTPVAQSRATAAKILVKGGHTPGQLKVQTASLFDTSGSNEFPHRRFYSRGYMGALARVVLGAALMIDDNKNTPAWAFASDVTELPAITEGNVDTYVDSHLMRLANHGGGTHLGKGMQAVMKGFDRASKDPGLVFVFTDGEATDSDLVIRLLREYSNRPVFWQFVGIHVPGDVPEFGLLEKLDSLSGRVIDNANFWTAQVEEVTPEQVMTAMLGEFMGFPKLLAANSSRVHW